MPDAGKITIGQFGMRPPVSRTPPLRIAMIQRTMLLVVFSLACSISGHAQDSPLIGIDSNFALDMATRKKAWQDQSHPVDVFELFSKQECQNARIRLWVGNEGINRLDYATQTALRAQQAGLKPYLVI